jgi:hypothetical protein
MAMTLKRKKLTVNKKAIIPHEVEKNQTVTKQNCELFRAASMNIK